MEIMNEHTHGICSTCYHTVPASVYEQDGAVHIKKNCPDHGESSGLIEKDVEFYKWFLTISPVFHERFQSVLLPVTFRCNMNCTYCFSWYPDRKDIPFEDLEKLADSFEGQFFDLTGGEPTVREDLDRVINMLTEKGKWVMLVTNGLRLADRSYVRKLKKAGLKQVFFSLDSFHPELFQSIKLSNLDGSETLRLKMKALKNLERESIPVILSATIYPGHNEKEIRDLFLYAVKNSHFINQVRFRSCVNVGKNSDESGEGYLLSELFSMFTKETGIVPEDIKTRYLRKRMGKSIIFTVRGKINNDTFDIDPQFSVKAPTKRELDHLSSDVINNSLYHMINRLKSTLIRMLPRKTMTVKLVGWPTVNNIDLDDLMTPTAYYSPETKSLNKIFHGVILDEKPETYAENE